MYNASIPIKNGKIMTGYLALPPVAGSPGDDNRANDNDTTKAPGIVLIQEIFGVNEVMRDIADKLAEQGFITLVPDLFWRLEPHIQLTDQSEDEWTKAFTLFQHFDVEQGIHDLADAMRFLRAHDRCTGKVGTQGYCLGGKMAFLMSTCTDTDASVSYYGVGLENMVAAADQISTPLMLHIAEKDEYSPPEAQAKIIAALKDNPLVTIHSYPEVNHAFARVEGMHYNIEAAKLANQRTHDFMVEYLS